MERNQSFPSDTHTREDFTGVFVFFFKITFTLYWAERRYQFLWVYRKNLSKRSLKEVSFISYNSFHISLLLISFSRGQSASAFSLQTLYNSLTASSFLSDKCLPLFSLSFCAVLVLSERFPFSFINERLLREKFVGVTYVCISVSVYVCELFCILVAVFHLCLHIIFLLAKSSKDGVLFPLFFVFHHHHHQKGHIDHQFTKDGCRKHVYQMGFSISSCRITSFA